MRIVNLSADPRGYFPFRAGYPPGYDPALEVYADNNRAGSHPPRAPLIGRVDAPTARARAQERLRNDQRQRRPEIIRRCAPVRDVPLWNRACLRKGTTSMPRAKMSMSSWRGAARAVAGDRSIRGVAGGEPRAAGTTQLFHN